jgi:hypothetical protein
MATVRHEWTVEKSWKSVKKWLAERTCAYMLCIPNRSASRPQVAEHKFSSEVSVIGIQIFVRTMQNP